MTYRVKCVECENLIQPQIAAANDGRCGQCVRISSELLAEKREYERQLEEGALFVPSREERARASKLNKISTFEWRLESEYYAEHRPKSPSDAISAARARRIGEVFLVTGENIQLNLCFNSRYGVCDFQSLETGEFRYAYSELNCREQVPEQLHVIQACPCCGIGLLWYPSRAHMPREDAFRILENAVAGKGSPDVNWLQFDDFSRTQRGRG